MEEDRSIKVMFSGEIIAKGPCGGGGCHCLWATCPVQENLVAVATAREAAGAGDSHARTLDFPHLPN